MLRRRSTPNVAPAALLALVALLVGLVVGAAPAAAMATVEQALAPTPATPTTCAAVVAAAAVEAPEADPVEGWATWWATSALEAARLHPTCSLGDRGPVAPPVWRSQVAVRLATALHGRAGLGQWLLRTAFPPTRLHNPLGAMVDTAAEGARAAAVTPCGLSSGLLATTVWLADPSVVDGDLPLADDGTLPAGDTPGLAAWRSAITPPPAPTPTGWVAPATAAATAVLAAAAPDPTPETPPLQATLEQTATWLCGHDVDLATPDGQVAALDAALGDGPGIGVARLALTQFGHGPLDPHVVIPPISGRLELVAVGRFRVSATVAPGLTRLLADAAADGVVLTGGAYRSIDDQVERRRANCAGEDGVADDYELWEMPSSGCSPRTARPGSSMHESGEAVDFERCQTRATPCFQWLARYAHRYGLHNLPEEPWHWSVNGR